LHSPNETGFDAAEGSELRQSDTRGREPMRKPLLAASWMLMALTFACSPGGKDKSAPASVPSANADIGTAEVRAAADVRIKAIETGDVEAYLSVYADDAVWMPPAAMEIVGKDAARRRIAQTFKLASLEPVMQSREQAVMSPEWIADRGQYSVIVTPKGGGESKQEVGSFLTLWRRTAEGKWKICYDIWNTNSPIVDQNQAK
jgi:uncharacterized protein (TIGR02246 family)